MKGLLDPILMELCEQGEYMGLSLLVARHGEILYRKEVGFADVETKAPIRPDTIFHLYSMTKPVTSAAIMKLWEEGKLNIDNSVSLYLPGFLNQKVNEYGRLVDVDREVTIRDLLNMTSGIAYPGGEETPEVNALFDEAMKKADTSEAIDTVTFANRLGHLPLKFQPGARWEYGASADVLGAVVEIVTGMSFGDYLRKQFFDPLGMVDTAFYIPREKKSRLAAIYHMANGTEPVRYGGRHLVILDYDSEPAFQSGGAGLCSTMDDYLKFAMMLANRGIYKGKRYLNERTVAFMSSSQLNETQQRTFDWPIFQGYGYGNLMRVLLEPSKAAMPVPPGEYGWEGWTGSYFEIHPVEDTVILLMTAQLDRDNFANKHKIRSLVYENITRPLMT